MQVVLREAGFTTLLTLVDRSATVCFEDDSLMGFGRVFSQPADLIAQWRATETSLLTRYAPSFRAAGDKAWNVYTVLLCGSIGDPIQNRKVRWIEEDLERTRKISACGIASREDMCRALLPLLPLQYQPVLQAEDVTLRLQRRIRTIAPKAATAALDKAVPAVEVVRLLGEPT
jgi:hypothetical protein